MNKISSAIAIFLLAIVPAFAQDQTAPPADANVPVPQAVAQAPTNPVMTGPRLLIATSMGDITLQLDSVRAPKSVANVLRYVKEKHYDNTAFYRVAKSFVIQMGSWDAAGKPPGISPRPVPLGAKNSPSNLHPSLPIAPPPPPAT